MSAADRERPPRAATGEFVKTPESVERDAEAFRLRGQGWTYQKISDHLALGSEGNARRAIANAVARIDAPVINELRAEQAAQLDYLQQLATALAENPETEKQLEAVRTVKQLMERRASLLGLDAPSRVEVDGKVINYTIDGVPPDAV